MEDEIVIDLTKVPTKPGWPCPSCGGMGTNCDGSVSMSMTEMRIRPASKCHTCRGKGRVKLTAFTDEELP
jgi:hypothetical protein